MKTWNTVSALALVTLLSACGPAPSASHPDAVITADVQSNDGTSTATVTETALKEALETVTSTGDVVRLKDVNGREVEVAFGEFERAVAQTIRSKNRFFNALFINGDGSVTMDAPRFMFRGQERLFQSTPATSSGSATVASGTGICKHFGFTRVVFQRSVTNARFQEQPWMTAFANYVTVDADGYLAGEGAVASSSSSEYVTTITCVNR